MASAVKAAGSMVLNKPDQQCGSGPRAQCSDDRIASYEGRLISVGRLLFARPGPVLWDKARRVCRKNDAKLPNCLCLNPMPPESISELGKCSSPFLRTEILSQSG